jgi:hypothetical protein
MARDAATDEGGLMKCEETAEFLSRLCDGQVIQREAAEHIGTCQRCRARLNEYLGIGVELRRLASLEQAINLKPRSWETTPRVRLQWWRKGRTTMRIPRFAFAAMLVVILLLSSGIFLVRARTDAGGSVFVLTFKVLPEGYTRDCVITTDTNANTSQCGYRFPVKDGVLGLVFRFISRDGDRTQVGLKAMYKSPSSTFNFIDDLKNVSERIIWLQPDQKNEIVVSSVGQIELAGEYLDHQPRILERPSETLEPQSDEFRVVAPVLIRGNEIVCNLSDNGNSIDNGDADATLMIYSPHDGRYLISRVPFEGAVEGSVRMGQIRFKLGGQDYLLLSAMPIVRSDHVWVSHDPEYRISEHIQDASNDRPMFRVRSLRLLLQPQIRNID